jgi:transcriptional regulator with XRE-family HTH domain
MATKANKELYEKTAARLRNLMKERDIRAIDLANKSGVSKSNISQYVNAYHAPNTITAYKLASVLNCSPAFLMGFDVEPFENVPSNQEKRLTEYAFRIAKLYQDAPDHVKDLVDRLLTESENK